MATSFAAPKIIQPLNFRSSSSNEKPQFDSIPKTPFLGSVHKLCISKLPISVSSRIRSFSSSVVAVSDVVKEKKSKSSAVISSNLEGVFLPYEASGAPNVTENSLSMKISDFASFCVCGFMISYQWN